MPILRITALCLALLGGSVACADTDVPNREDGAAPGQELEASGAERDVEPVDIRSQPWFREGRTIQFGDRAWVLVGEPIYDPMVEYVGEFEGTQLYAEVGVGSPYSQLFIPLEQDYWQRLEPGRRVGPDTTGAAPTGVPGVD